MASVVQKAASWDLDISGIPRILRTLITLRECGLGDFVTPLCLHIFTKVDIL